MKFCFDACLVHKKSITQKACIAFTLEDNGKNNQMLGIVSYPFAEAHKTSFEMENYIETERKYRA